MQKGYRDPKLQAIKPRQPWTQQIWWGLIPQGSELQILMSSSNSITLSLLPSGVSVEGVFPNPRTRSILPAPQPDCL